MPIVISSVVLLTNEAIGANFSWAQHENETHLERDWHNCWWRIWDWFSSQITQVSQVSPELRQGKRIIFRLISPISLVEFLIPDFAHISEMHVNYFKAMYSLSPVKFPSVVVVNVLQLSSACPRFIPTPPTRPEHKRTIEVYTLLLLVINENHKTHPFCIMDDESESHSVQIKYKTQFDQIDFLPVHHPPGTLSQARTKQHWIINCIAWWMQLDGWEYYTKSWPRDQVLWAMRRDTHIFTIAS